MPLSKSSPSGGLLVRQIKAAMPSPLKAVLRPAVRAIAPDVPDALPPAPTDPLAFCDSPLPNAWTVRSPKTGLEHRFFYLCGCWKSGTHWVQNILNLHPQVNMKGEYHFEVMLRALDRFTNPHWHVGHGPKARRVASRAMQNLVRRTMYATTRDRPEALWLGDRTPRHLREVLPGAPMLWLLRDGRDVLVSWSFHWLRVKNPRVFNARFKDQIEKFAPEFALHPDRFRDPETGLLGDDRWVRRTAREWAGYIRNDTAQFAALTGAGTPVHRVGYEQLHASPHEGAAEMYRFLGLDPALAQPLSTETKTLPGFKSENLKSATRKGETGDWRNYFNERISRIFKEEAGQALVDAGYEKDLNW